MRILYTFFHFWKTRCAAFRFTCILGFFSSSYMFHMLNSYVAKRNKVWVYTWWALIGNKYFVINSIITLKNMNCCLMCVSLCVCVYVQVCFGTCRHVMLWRCRSSRTLWPFSPIASSYPTLTGTPPPITMTTASSIFIPPRCCAMLQGVSGKSITHTHTHSKCEHSCSFLVLLCCWDSP